MPTTVTRAFEFDAAHRVLGHEGKCASLHGHRYRAEVTVTAPGLDRLGRVVDFSEVKRLAGGWIETHWDHTAILHEDDPLLPGGDVFGPRRPYVMPPDTNPTAEEMARVLHDECEQMLDGLGLAVVRVRLYETPNCWADFPA